MRRKVKAQSRIWRYHFLIRNMRVPIISTKPWLPASTRSSSRKTKKKCKQLFHFHPQIGAHCRNETRIHSLEILRITSRLAWKISVCFGGTHKTRGFITTKSLQGVWGVRHKWKSIKRLKLTPTQPNLILTCKSLQGPPPLHSHSHHQRKLNVRNIVKFPNTTSTQPNLTLQKV